jgi:hypothetical protein
MTQLKICGPKLSSSNVSLLVPIAEITIITLTMAMIEKTGLLATTTEKFRLRPITEWTVALFKADSILGNKERILRPTVVCHQFSHTDASTGDGHCCCCCHPHPSAPAAARHVTVEGGEMFYCWTRGLSPQRNHTPITCLNKAEGHRDDATAFRKRGGNNTISSG